eukprot:TRINITY_DN1035_c0_g1_i2.p1 TRINITY_DN1035_c0_g1~~TRINITY_DN1035_c0_g1_i2.p1  ORF type:complete len:399 (+),score=129.56 TRINITY_DN1035_c0_g1_i2:231-1427(+)
MFDSDDEFDQFEKPLNDDIKYDSKTSDPLLLLEEDDLLDEFDTLAPLNSSISSSPVKTKIDTTSSLSTPTKSEEKPSNVPRGWPPRRATVSTSTTAGSGGGTSSTTNSPLSKTPSEIKKQRRKSADHTRKRYEVAIQRQQRFLKSKNVNSNDDEIPPEFPPPPPKMEKFEGGNREAYKAFMQKRLIYEQWENGLILYRIRMKEGNHEACQKIIERLITDIAAYYSPAEYSFRPPSLQSKYASMNSLPQYTSQSSISPLTSSGEYPTDAQANDKASKYASTPLPFLARQPHPILSVSSTPAMPSLPLNTSNSGSLPPSPKSETKPKKKASRKQRPISERISSDALKQALESESKKDKKDPSSTSSTTSGMLSPRKVLPRRKSQTGLARISTLFKKDDKN